MNIKLLDSWIREYLKTNVTSSEFAKLMSASSVSVERMEKVKNDYLYDFEITTNRPDLMSVLGIAREGQAVLKQYKKEGKFTYPSFKVPQFKNNEELPLNIITDENLVNRVCAVILEVKVANSPKEIQERLETSEIRSLNNIIDITNYVMRVIGHPTHVFDYDKLKTKTIKIRLSRPNERITTLDGKEYKLQGDDIVAEDGIGNIIDLLGIMGLKNSVVDSNTTKIVYFIDNLDTNFLRKTSMQHGIRTQAAILNEKGIDPNLALDALLYGISLYQDLAGATLLSNIIDIRKDKPKIKKVSVDLALINTVIGKDIPADNSLEILDNLGFQPKLAKNQITVIVPTYRENDISLPEDIIEEIARIYGYHNIPTRIPAFIPNSLTFNKDNEFELEKKIKYALKYWGFTEVYTYPMVSEDLYEGPIDDAVTLQNPLGEEFTYLRNSLVPSLLNVVSENKSTKDIKIFEISNVYLNKSNDLPNELLKFAGVVKKEKASYYDIKGILEQLLNDLGIKNLTFKPSKLISVGADIYSNDKLLGSIEVLDENIVNFELSFDQLLNLADSSNTYIPIHKYPKVEEDLSIIIDNDVSSGEITDTIKNQSNLIMDVYLFDKYEDKRTFHITYQNEDKNLTSKEVSQIRKDIISTLIEKYKAEIK